VYIYNHSVWLYPRRCTPIFIKISQHLLKLCTKVFWFVCFCVMRHSVVDINSVGDSE